MIQGVGTDMIEIARIEKACEREAFFMRVYTERERRQAKGKASKLAGDFAVKEAVAKVLGTGFRTFLPSDIEVLRDELGKPYVELKGKAAEAAGAAGISNIQVSITNTDKYAMAFAVGEGGKA